MTTLIDPIQTFFAGIFRSSFTSTLFEIVVVVVVAVICQFVVRHSLRRLKKYLIYTATGTPQHREARASTLTRVMRSTINALIWAIAILMILDAVGLSIAPFIASAGVVGLAISFGAQELIRDGFTGLFFLIENQFNVGSNLQIADKKGIVIKMDLRTVTLRDEDNKAIYIFRNSQIGALSKFDPGAEAEEEPKKSKSHKTKDTSHGQNK